MCSLIIGIFLFIIICALILGGIIFAADLISGILFILALARYGNSKKLTPSKMICPNCGSANVHLSTTLSSIEHNSIGDYGSGLSFHSGSSKVNHKRIAICQDCGFTYDYITSDEVTEEQNVAKGSLFIFTVLFGACIAFTLFVLN